MNWISTLTAGGLFFLGLGWGLGLGWVWPSAQGIKIFLPVLALTCLALFCFVGAAIGLHVRERKKRRRAWGALRSVDLEDSLRTLRAFGVIAPLYEQSGLRSELLSVRIPRNMAFKKNSSVILEHWEGPEVTIKTQDNEITLEPKQIVRLSSAAGVLVAPSDGPRKNSKGLRDDSVVLMHVIEEH